MAEFQVIREELGRIGSKEQVLALDKAIINNITEEQRGHLLELTLRREKNPGQVTEPDRPSLQDPRDGKDNVNFDAGTNEGEGTGKADDRSDLDINIRMPDGTKDLSISVAADAADEEKADTLQNIADALKVQRTGEKGSGSDEQNISRETTKDVGESVISLVPGLGNVLSAKDAYQAFKAAGEAYEKGDTTEAGIQSALGVIDAVGAIPGPGNIVKGAKEIISMMAKGGKRLLKKDVPTPNGHITPGSASAGPRASILPSRPSGPASIKLSPIPLRLYATRRNGRRHTAQD